MSRNHEPPTDPLIGNVRRESARRARHRQEGERPLGLDLATIGALGWLVVTPMLGGVLAGRALDRLAGTGILWTGAFLVAGAALGGWLAWRRMMEMGSE
jgi:ATP synthase protein I